MLNLSDELVQAALDAWIGAGGKLEDATIGLHMNDWDYNTNASPVTADLTAPTYTGYAPQPAVWDTFTDVDGNLFVKCEELEFVATNATSLPLTIFGAYVREETSNDFLAGGRLDEPIIVTRANQPFHITVMIPIARLQTILTNHGYIA